MKRFSQADFEESLNLYDDSYRKVLNNPNGKANPAILFWISLICPLGVNLLLTLLLKYTGVHRLEASILVLDMSYTAWPVFMFFYVFGYWGLL